MAIEAEDIVLIIPVYNPEPGWEIHFLSGYKRFCKSLSMSVPVIICNDGSSVDLKESLKFLENELVTSLHIIEAPQNEGKGAALKRGAAHRKVKHYIFTDHDFPYTTESMLAVIQKNLESGGIAMGVRDEMYYRDMTTFRKFISKILKKMNAWLLKLPSNDTQCGLKAFDDKARDVLLSCQVNRFLIDLEFLLAAHKKGIHIQPVPVVLRQEILFSKFRLSLLMKEIGQFVQLVWKHRF